MEQYNPIHSPNPEDWLSIDEGIRINMVREYVDANEEHLVTEESAKSIHAAIHVVVENQLALDAEPVPETMARLIRQGLTRHDAIHAIGAVLSDRIFEVINGNEELPMPRYKSKLNKLTAKRWKKGKW